MLYVATLPKIGVNAMKIKKAMSLSEVLVCLAVVGVLAMILVPILTKTTTGKEKFLYKKAINTMQNAVSAVMQDNTVMNSSNFWPELSNSGLDVRNAIADKIILEGPVNNTGSGSSSFANPDFVSSDGMIWWGLPTTWEQNNAGSAKTYYDVYVDVNGEKGINRSSDDLASSAEEKKPDQLKMRLMKDGRVIVPSYDSTSGNDWSFENEYLSSSSPTEDK